MRSSYARIVTDTRMPALLLALVAFIAVPQQEFLREALSLGRTRDRALYDAFTAGYQLTPSGVVDRIEVVSEFRRAVMIVRDHSELGDYSFGENDLAAALGPYRGVVGVVAEVRLHPLHTYSQPPAYDFYVRTGPTTKPIAAAGLKRTPIFPPGINTGSAMSAVRLEGAVGRADVAAATDPFLVIVDDSGAVIWQARFDVSRFR